MFSQLVGYYFSINFSPGGVRRLWRIWFSGRAQIFVVVLTGLSVGAVTALRPYFWNETVFFVAVAPLAFYLGSGAALLVLAGKRDAQAENMTIQNVVVLGMLGCFWSAQRLDLLVYAWPVGLAAGLVGLRKSFGGASGVDEGAPEKGCRASRGTGRAVYSFLHPTTVFAAVLTERFFYAQMSGMVAVVKILETLATSAVFVTHVGIFNGALHELNQKFSYGGLRRYDAVSILKRSMLRSLAGAEVLYVVGLLFLFAGLGAFPKFLGGSASARGIIPLFGALYAAYVAMTIFREHSERLSIVTGSQGAVVLAGAAVVGGTLLLNAALIAWAPTSIVLVSIVLGTAKAIFLIKRFDQASEQ